MNHRLLIICLCGMLMLAGYSPGARALELEMGSVEVLDTFVTPAWTSVSFQQAFDTVPHVYVLPTNEGGDPSTLRIRNVTSTGFEVIATEPSANDGPHVAMNTAYLAIEPGVHTLPGGARIISIERSTTTFATRLIPPVSFDTVVFPIAFSGAPAVLGSIQTVANESGTPPGTSSTPFLEVGIQNVTATSMQVTLERAESTAGSVTTPERIAILAIDNNTLESFVDVNTNTIQLQGFTTPTNIQGWDNGCFTNSYPASFSSTPLAVASMNTRIGNNGGWIRRCSESSSSIGLTVDEDIDADSERAHIGESAAVVAASTAFHASINADLQITKSMEVLSDPINGINNPKAIPTSTVSYIIEVENTGVLSTDDGTLIVLDEVPDTVSLCVSTDCLAGGPVLFDDTGSPIATGVSLGSVTYSNDGGSNFTYPPNPDGDGYDSQVDAVRIAMNGAFAGIAGAGAPRFELRLAARVE